MRRLALLCAPVALTLAMWAPLGSAQEGEPESRWLQQLAHRYRTWGRVDDQLRWAPFDCRMQLPSRARVSRAGSAHGRKVYFVYASDRVAYRSLTEGQTHTPPVGLTIVKEAFTPRSLGELPASRLARDLFVRIPGAPAESPTEPGSLVPSSENVYLPIVDPEGHRLGAGAPRGLYALRYLGEGVRGTDAGWVYGTVAADGEVTSSGRVARCIRCHLTAPHGRLFGLETETRAP